MLLAVLPVASALDLDTFELAGSALDGRGGLQVLAPDIDAPGGLYGGLALTWAKDPVVRTFADGTQEPFVSSAFATHVAGGYTFGHAARVDVDVPLYPYVGAETADGFAMGDIRLGAVVPLLRGDDVGVAVAPQLALPTGNASAYTGGGFAGALTLSAGATPGKAFVVGNLGVEGTPADALGDLQLGSGLHLGAGAGAHVAERFTLGAELDSFVTIAGGIGPFNKNPVELHGYATYGGGEGLVATLGAGTGLVAGVGAPDVRLVGMIGWHAPGEEPIPDADGDGVPDAADRCADTAEDMDAFEDDDGCPDVDDDRDGIADTADECRFDPEDRDRFEDEDGCPEKDNDEDGLADDLDACPDTKGPASTGGCPDADGDALADQVDACPTEPGPRSTQGCPDRDLDQVADSRDKCPDEPRDPREDLARSDGCPHRVVVTVEKIEIKDMIFFDTNKTTIKKESWGLLDEIAGVIAANPDLARIEVAGHTDDVGDDARNLKLSQGRAQAVVDYLVKNGHIDPARLVAVGYGETKPLQPGTSDAARAANRRVEFVLKDVRRPQ